jgi:glucose-6-phosphate 1-dehydrogenase
VIQNRASRRDPWIAGRRIPDAYRDEKARVLMAVRPLEARHVVRGQYDGYRSAPGVDSGSTVETYAAVKLMIDNWRWSGVPVYIRSGKELAATATEVFIELRRPPRETFGERVPPPSGHSPPPHQPGRGHSPGAAVKVPGDRMVRAIAELMVTSRPGDLRSPYQRLLTDAMYGIQELFAREDGVEASGASSSRSWRQSPTKHLPAWKLGTKAEKLIGRDGPWIDPLIGPVPAAEGCEEPKRPPGPKRDVPPQEGDGWRAGPFYSSSD